MLIKILGSGSAYGTPMCFNNWGDIVNKESPHNLRSRFSIYLEDDGHKMLVDMGPEFRLQTIENKITDIDGVFLTHGHYDHIAGVPELFRAAALLNKQLNIYTSEETLQEVKNCYAYMFGNFHEAGKEKITQAHISIPMTDRLGDLVIEANGISKGYGDRLLIDNLSFKIPKGAIVGIIGPNGAGKTTLFRMITGQEKPDSGEIRIGETVDLGYVDQSREELNPNKTVWEEISDGLDIIELGKKQMPSRAYVGQFNFKGGDQQKKVGQLSGGERNRVHLAKMLRKGANVILLDEPTNDLDVDTLRSLEEGIMEYPGCVLVTSHDRWFLDRLATHILAYEGDSQVVWFEGNFEEYEKDKRRRLGDEACNPHRVRYKKLA